LTLSGLVCVVWLMKEPNDTPSPAPALHSHEIDLTELGTTGLLDYCAGVSPHHPKAPLAKGGPNTNWRIIRAAAAYALRAGDAGRTRFLAAARAYTGKLRAKEGR